LRLSIYACIHWCAESLGMVADASILPFLPHELREIMAKADAALQGYRGFSGQKTLIKQLNELPHVVVKVSTLRLPAWADASLSVASSTPVLYF
jgi:hypothetical protein